MLFKLLKGDFSGLENIKNQIIELSQVGQSLRNFNTSIDNISKISRDVFTTDGVNITSIELYRKSLEGLTIEQKALALSTSSLTEEEIKEMLTRQDNAIVSKAISESEAEAIISKMGLITTTQLLSETELEELSTRVGLEAQIIKNALIETGLVTVKNGDVITTKELTEAELEEALTSEGAALADKKQTAQIIAETIAKKTNIGITKQYAGNTNLLIGAFDKLKTVIATHPILTFATILGAGIYAIKKYKDSIDSLIESGKNITSEYESKVNDLHKNQSEFSTLATRYSELSDGVNSLGQNVSLTSDEFSEYKDIVNKIGNLSPNLIKGYSDEGDAILKIKDNVEALTEAYNQNIIAANNSILSNAKTVTEATNKSEVKYSAKDSSKYQVEGLEGLLNGTLSASDVMSRYRDVYSGGLYGYEYKDLTKLLNSLGIDVGFTKDDEFWTSESEANEFNKKLETTLNNLNSDQRNILQGYITRRNSEYEEIFKGSRDILKANIENAILTDNDLQNLPEELKTTLLNISDSLDVETFKRYNSPEELAQYASTITDAFKTLSPTHQEDIEMGINLSTQWNNNELSYDEYITKVQEFVKLLETLFPNNKEIVESFKVLFDIPDEEELAKQQDIFVNRLGKKVVSGKKSSTTTSNSNPILDQEKQKLVDWGKEVGKDYTQFEDDIESGVLHKFGNVDMDKRAIIKWSDELKKTYEKELASWEYDPEIGSIDTVWGQSTAFEWDNQEHEIAFTPIMETEDGAVFLGEKEVYDYINSVIAKAGEDGEITADEIFKIDAVETGKQYGEQFGKGLIAGVDESTGNVGIDAIDAGNLMHFSGKYGAVKLAKDAETTYAGASKAGMPSDVENRFKAQGTEVADAWYDSLTKSQREFVDNVSDEDLAEAVKFDSTEQFDEWLKKLQDQAEIDAEVNFKESSAVDSMADMKKAVGSLGDLYNQTVKKAATAGQATGYADPDLLNNVESSFYKFSEELKAEGNDAAANEINQALEEFEKTLVEFPGYADKAQGAINNLITAYIDQTDAIQNLTEENKEWSKAQLKAMGIINAEEVVESRLSSTTKKLAEHFKTAASALQTLTSAQEGSTEYNDAMTSVGDRLGEMFSYTGENGETIVPNFDPTWIIQNLDLLKSAASGSTEAMYELQRAAAKKIAASVEINLPDQSAINGELNYINSLIDNFDISDIEVGTSLNDTPMIQGLNNLVNAGIITRDSMNAILSGIGVEPEITYEDVPITVAGDALTKTNTTAGIQMQKGVKEAQRVGASVSGTVRVPKIDYQVTSKSVGAQYANPSNNNTGGNTGGSPDSGGKTDKDKVNEDEPEQFDWIQVKIQRLEEEIERLGKKANDTFSSWTNRTKALNKEISKTTAEIKAQQQAQNRYEANFKKIKVNNGKEINEEEYSDNKKQLDYDKDQLKKAKAAWSKLYKDSKGRYYDKNGNITKDKKKAVGHYQYLIQQGKIGKKDIENIPNRFLAETIKNAQEIWQKSVDARDAVQDLQLQLKELNKQKFDNITTRFSNAMDVISKKSDLIQKKIDRTETMGYFVDESYYKKQRQLLTNNSKNKDKEGQLQKQIRERDEHIAQLNAQEALDKKKGGVDFKSEAWYEMYNQIMDDNAAIEETRNQIAELDKQIKQLAWDKFDYLREKLDDITAEAEYLQEILSSEKMMDDYGFYNNRGWANAAMITVQYKEAQKGMNEVLKERAKITDAMRKNNKDEEDRWQDLTDKARDYAKAMMAAKDAMKSFVEESRLMLSYPIR